MEDSDENRLLCYPEGLLLREMTAVTEDFPLKNYYLAPVERERQRAKNWGGGGHEEIMRIIRIWELGGGAQ